MKPNHFFILFPIILSFYSNDIKADISSFDIAEIEINGRNYFIMFETPGYLHDNDFCYYNNDNEYIFEVEEIVKKKLSEKDIIFYKELHIIDLDPIPDYDWEGNENLFVLKNEMPKDSVNYKDTFELISIQRGNTFGFIYSDSLSEDDNTWMSNNQIEKMFSIPAYDLCEMSLYCIKGSIPEYEKNKLKDKLTDLSKDYETGEFKDEIEELYKENIIMIGFCSC